MCMDKYGPSLADDCPVVNKIEAKKKKKKQQLQEYKVKEKKLR